jgi:adenylyltransferase/sulfurtransferase
METVNFPTISVADLKKGLAENSLELIDIRTDMEREEFNIGGIHVPLDQLYSFIANANKNVKTVLYCASGKRSGEAIKSIKKNFPDANVFSLDGGLKAWIED